MILGMGMTAEILQEDDDVITYKYYSYNKNLKGYSNEWKLADGLISIKKTVFQFPIMINYYNYIRQGLIKIENTFNCWNTTIMGADSMATRFISRLLDCYSNNKRIPNKIEIHY